MASLSPYSTRHCLPVSNSKGCCTVTKRPGVLQSPAARNIEVRSWRHHLPLAARNSWATCSTPFTIAVVSTNEGFRPPKNPPVASLSRYWSETWACPTVWQPSTATLESGSPRPLILAKQLNRRQIIVFNGESVFSCLMVLWCLEQDNVIFGWILIDSGGMWAESTSRTYPLFFGIKGVMFGSAFHIDSIIPIGQAILCLVINIGIF